MGDLNDSELRRIQRTLRARFRIGPQTNIIDIGFGAAVKRGKLEPSRGLCITFLVRNKKTPRRKSGRIPPKLDVRLKRGKRFVKLSFRTDVVEVGRIVATGRRLEYRTKHMTTGVIVAWKSPSASLLSWGLVTVGHAFPRLRTLSHSRRQVAIRTSRGRFAGILIAKSDNDPQIDAAIAQVEKQELISKELMTPSQSHRRIVPRKVTMLQSDRNKAGATLRIGGRRRFVVHAYFPTIFAAGAGTIANVVSVLSGGTRTFETGTSGSSWLIQNQASCLQVAGRRSDFKQGFGPSLESIVQWAAKELNQQGLIQPGSFRTVTTF